MTLELISDLVCNLDGDGRLTGNDAIKFFSMSNLPRPDLKQVSLSLVLTCRSFILLFGCFSLFSCLEMMEIEI